MSFDEPYQRIRLAMSDARLTNAADLARATGINPVTMRSYVNGLRKPPLDACLEIGAALRVNGRWLFDGSQKMHDGVGAASSRPALTEALGGRPAIVPNARDPRPIPPDYSGETLPVYGSAMGGPDGRFEHNGQIIDRVAAPPGLRGTKDAYAIYVVGESMVPRYEEGEAVYVHPGKPPRSGDYIVLQLKPKVDGDPYEGLVKRLVSRGASKIVVEQFNPPMTIEFAANEVRAIHKIVLSGEG